VNLGRGFKLSEELVTTMHDHGIFFFMGSNMRGTNNYGRSKWKYVDVLEIKGDRAVEWTKYTEIICSNFINLLEEEDDSLCWSKNEISGNYNAKLGCLSITEGFVMGYRKWWCPYV
jgi:hypothetical protein